jgi:hypothetical protein
MLLIIQTLAHTYCNLLDTTLSRAFPQKSVRVEFTELWHSALPYFEPAQNNLNNQVWSSPMNGAEGFCTYDLTTDLVGLG